MKTGFCVTLYPTLNYPTMLPVQFLFHNIEEGTLER